MNKYVKKGLCLVLATGLIASSFAGCAKVNYVTEGAIKAIHQLRTAVGRNKQRAKKPVLQKILLFLKSHLRQASTAELSLSHSKMLLTIIKRLMITLRLLLPSMSMIRVRLRLSTSSSVMRKLM